MTEGFEAWNEIYASGVHAGVDKPLVPGSVFLFESIMLGRVAPSGWYWFDSPRDLAGYLLHVALPEPRRMVVRRHQESGWAAYPPSSAADRCLGS